MFPSFSEIVLSFMEFFAVPNNVNKHFVGAGNIQMMVGSGIAAASATILRTREHIKTDPFAYSFVIGIQWAALGLLFHRLFWFLAVLFSAENVTYAAQFENAKWLTIIAVELMVIGYGRHTHPIMTTWKETSHWPRYVPWWGPYCIIQCCAFYFGWTAGN